MIASVVNMVKWLERVSQSIQNVERPNGLRGPEFDPSIVFSKIYCITNGCTLYSYRKNNDTIFPVQEE